jgi:hypothetical protein
VKTEHRHRTAASFNLSWERINPRALTLTCSSFLTLPLSKPLAGRQEDRQTDVETRRGGETWRRDVEAGQDGETYETWR